jgi:YbbR domain-containing protein
MAVPGTRHLGLKIVSVVLAALLWALVSGEQTVERALRIPLEFTNLPPQLDLVGEPPTVVDVRLRGSSGTMSRLAAGELAAVLDVRTARAGRRLFNLTTEDVRAPFGVEVVQVAPASVPLTFEESLVKTVTVSPRIEGEPAPGYLVSGVTVEPATVAVVGPVTAMANMSEAITESVNVSGAMATLTEMVTIGVADPLVRLREAQDARVTVAITAVPEEWSVEGITVQVRNGGAGVRIAPKSVTIRVRGPRKSREADAASFSASVDVTGLGAGTHRAAVRVEPPLGVGLLRVDPAEVTVTIP